ncbi:hypothetical protein ASPVEDRAFT_35316 [Aspergillus versicolor CBS 583.65]|uniref:RING-type domain-containing protein n=1 Tax=Aspergillus versicolor CBS 583.65 TaxID=1036611 RepID=A0A1L9P3L9_ASPVE|nr:uncharacterized protein ASPVEDRAFT_35316 [Aspergillus versicolor CBS 583.65]OJI96003.1 hypothetical protein ASPVEDRAFT_35316 [Aspergillus versicolor CBS 583.65]
MDNQASSSQRRRISTVEIPSSSPPRSRRPSTQAGPSGSRKRRRLTNQSVSSTASQPENEPIESIDLTDVDGNSAIAKVLARQREDAVAAQHTDDSANARSRLTGYTCPVCMDTPVDATTTVCGHLFCHKCIIETLKFSEEQRADHTGKTPRGTCPVCRKPLARADAPGNKRNLIPLQIKLVTKKRTKHGGTS